VARGSRIIVSSAVGLAAGISCKAGLLGDSSVPGTNMAVKYNTPVSGNGQFTWIASAPLVNGYSVLSAILVGDVWDGLISTVTPGINTTVFMGCALPGDEYNILVGLGSGTTNYLVVGEKLYADAVGGVWVPVIGAGGSWMILETVTGVAADYLTWALKL
jgi:hypothetical protein